MSGRSHLKAVPPGARKPRPARLMTVTQAASDGDARELLVAMRSRIAKAVEDANTPARDLAALTKRLMEVVRDIEAFDTRREESNDDASSVEDGTFDASAI